jgi:hypothetical protein
MIGRCHQSRAAAAREIACTAIFQRQADGVAVTGGGRVNGGSRRYKTSSPRVR